MRGTNENRLSNQHVDALWGGGGGGNKGKRNIKSACEFSLQGPMGPPGPKGEPVSGIFVLVFEFSSFQQRSRLRRERHYSENGFLLLKNSRFKLWFWIWCVCD